MCDRGTVCLGVGAGVGVGVIVSVSVGIQQNNQACSPHKQQKRLARTSVVCRAVLSSSKSFGKC